MRELVRFETIIGAGASRPVAKPDVNRLTPDYRSRPANDLYSTTTITAARRPYLQKHVLGADLLSEVDAVLWLRPGVVRVVQLGALGHLVRVPDGLRRRTRPLGLRRRRGRGL